MILINEFLDVEFQKVNKFMNKEINDNYDWLLYHPIKDIFKRGNIDFINKSNLLKQEIISRADIIYMPPKVVRNKKKGDWF